MVTQTRLSCHLCLSLRRKPQPAPEESASPAAPQSVPREWNNALQAGRDYLRIMPFSFDSLSRQLEFENYPSDAIAWAMAQIDAETNWREQAVRSAEQYLDIMSFSRSGLIEQLVFEGFTQADAAYAAGRVF